MAQEPRRNVGLDVLRCVAIVGVLANHAFLNLFVEHAHVASWTGGARRASLLSFLSIEWLFVLSGFLIGTMMIRAYERPGTFWTRTRSFWLRRWFRTVPNYYLFLLVNIALFAGGLVIPFGSGPPTWRHAVFSHNLYRPEDIPFFFSESWSLALDEWFYLLLPLLMGVAALVRARSRDTVLAATGVLVLVPLALRLLVPLPPEDDPLEWDHRVRRITLLHLDATGWGVFAAAVNRWFPQAWHRAKAAKALLGALLTAVGMASLWAYFDVLGGPMGAALTASPRIPVAWSLTFIGLGAALALPAIAALPARDGALRAVSAWMSNASYSVYLSHIPLLVLGIAAFEALGGDAADVRQLAVLTAVWLAATWWLSALVYRRFEKPVSDIRERFTRKIDASPFGPAPPP